MYCKWSTDKSLSQHVVVTKMATIVFLIKGALLKGKMRSRRPGQLRLHEWFATGFSTAIELLIIYTNSRLDAYYFNIMLGYMLGLVYDIKKSVKKC